MTEEMIPLCLKAMRDVAGKHNPKARLIIERFAMAAEDEHRQLKERIAELEARLVDKELVPMSICVSPGEAVRVQAVGQVSDFGIKIKAIKEARQLLGLCLADAKNLVESGQHRIFEVSQPFQGELKYIRAEKLA